MTGYFVVRRTRGLAWDPACPMREQSLWAEHAAFMDGLVDADSLVLGGPLDDGDEFLLVMDVADAEAARRLLDRDPWTEADLLRTVSVERWSILLDGRAGTEGP